MANFCLAGISDSGNILLAGEGDGLPGGQLSQCYQDIVSGIDLEYFFGAISSRRHSAWKPQLKERKPFTAPRAIRRLEPL